MSRSGPISVDAAIRPDERFRVSPAALVTALVVVAIAVRLGAGWVRGPALLEDGNGLKYMLDLARRIASGDGYSTSNGIAHVFQQPAYPAYLALFFALFHASTWPVISFANALLGGALTWAAYRLGRVAFGGCVGVVAGAIAAFYPYLIWHGQTVSDTALFTFLLLGWLGAVLSDSTERPWRGALEAGLWLGAAFWTRPSLLPLIPVAFASIWIRTRSPAHALRHLAVSALLAFVITMPWLVRNHQLTDRFPMMGTHGSSALWAANADGAYEAILEDRSFDVVSGHWKYRDTDLDVWAFKTDFEPREAVRRQGVFSNALKETIQADPSRFVEMSLLRFVRLWDVRYHPTMRRSRPIAGVERRQILHATSYGPLLLLGLVGLVLALRDPQRRVTGLTLLAVLVVYSGAHAVGAFYSRVRLPLDPIIGVLAGLTIDRGLVWWRARGDATIVAGAPAVRGETT